MTVWVRVGDRLPEESGVYPAYSTNKDRTPPKNWTDVLYGYDKDAGKGKCRWQHCLGFFDNGITHWLEFDPPNLTGPE